MVAASSSFAAEIVNLYATDLELRVEVDDPRNFTEGLRVREGIPYAEEAASEEYIETLPIESQPQKRSKISISAASLERFHSNL